MPVEPETWALFAADRTAGSSRASCSTPSATRSHSELTPHQRTVLVALALNDVPIDVLAERLGTTRGALYKTLHDARRSLRRRLEADGLLTGKERA